MGYYDNTYQYEYVDKYGRKYTGYVVGKNEEDAKELAVFDLEGSGILGANMDNIKVSVL